MSMIGTAEFHEALTEWYGHLPVLVGLMRVWGWGLSVDDVERT